MFSPPAGPRRSARRRNPRPPPSSAAIPAAPPPASPSTPLDAAAVAGDARPPPSPIPNRPATGTPAPWATRPSLLARVSPANRDASFSDEDQMDPVYVGDFPQAARDAQNEFLRNSVTGDAGIYGGIDGGTCLAWLICGNQIFVWNFLAPSYFKHCVKLYIPSVVEVEHVGASSGPAKNWLVCFVKWEGTNKTPENVVPTGLIMCHRQTEAVAYWPNIHAPNVSAPIINTPSFTINLPQSSRVESKGLDGTSYLNSMIVSAVPGTSNDCLALASHSSGQIWRFYCSTKRIDRKVLCQISNDKSDTLNSGDLSGSQRGYVRSIIWDSARLVSADSFTRRFFVLTDREIQCWETKLMDDLYVSLTWCHEIVGLETDSDIKKDFAGQKQIWLLDMYFGKEGKEIAILVATICIDRVSSSNFTQYSLLRLWYEPKAPNGSFLKKKVPIQVIIPKARFEDVDFLLAMKLRVGGKPPGSAMILSGDGIATVAIYWRETTRLYQFDLPHDAGRVFDSAVLPSTEDSEEGAWILITEKTGLWTIPERAILHCGVEPPERSLSRKGSSKEGALEKEKRMVEFGVSIAPRSVSSDTWDGKNGRSGAFTGGPHTGTYDEESEALLGRLLNDYLSTGQVDESVEKLKNCKVFDRDGETNVFCRASKSIVDTLAKHWTTTRGPEILSLSVLSSQLIDKQQKHQKFLQFLALSRCHQELCAKQKDCLHIIMQHGEKLAAMIQLREMQNNLFHNSSTDTGLSSSKISGALWDLIQAVGDKMRRNNVLLMDRDNAEVFYSKVSDIEEAFLCITTNIEDIVGKYPSIDQVQRICELASSLTSIVRTAISYRTSNHIWYPPPEGLTPWYCQDVVRTGLWAVGSFILQIPKHAGGIDLSMRSEVYYLLKDLTEVLLEAYSGAIAAKIGHGNENNELNVEFWKRRDELLCSLYEEIKNIVEARMLWKLLISGVIFKAPYLYLFPCGSKNDSGEGAAAGGMTEQKDAKLQEMCASLFTIARKHGGYQALWLICNDLNDKELLLDLMREGMGPRGGFSAFVFKQLYEKRQYAKLLRLGEEFQEELALFLKQKKELLWLHEICLTEFSSASETLHELALSNLESTYSMSDKDSENFGSLRSCSSLADRKRFLYLSKMAVEAGGDANAALNSNRIMADLHLLRVQEDVTNLFPNIDKLLSGKLLPPTELIELCFKSGNRELSLKAFDVFAYTSSFYRRSNRNILEDCWRNAANQDDWAQAAAIAESWSDEEKLASLKSTVLFLASNRCYGLDSHVYEGTFEEVLPLQKDGENLGISVEEILMQHPNFTDAGHLMLLAIMMGKFGSSIPAEDESLMEP